MADLNKLIDKFIQENIALSQKDISESAKSREWFLARIKTKIEEENLFMLRVINITILIKANY